MELLGIQQILTSPYYRQGKGIIERSHGTVGNMVQAQLGHRDDHELVDVLPGIMLIYNEIEQENHGYTVSQIMWGQNIYLPTYLIHTPVMLEKGILMDMLKSWVKSYEEFGNEWHPLIEPPSEPSKSF